MSAVPRYKELNAYNNSLHAGGSDVGEIITMQKRLNHGKKMFSIEKNIHQKNQIYILGSQVEPHEGSRNTQYLSEYH